VQRDRQVWPATLGERTGQLDAHCERMALLAAAAAAQNADLAAMFLTMAEALDAPSHPEPRLRLIAKDGHLIADKTAGQQPV
jgi:hypothetical protein